MTVAARYYLCDGREFAGGAAVTTVREQLHWDGPTGYRIEPAFIFVGAKRIDLPMAPEDDLGRDSFKREMKAPLNKLLPAWFELRLPIAGESEPRMEVAWE